MTAPTTPIPPAVNLAPDRRRRRRLLALLIALLVLIAIVIALLIIYVFNPQPLPDLLPIDINYAPHHLFSIDGVDQPFGIALSPEDDRIYVSESGGERRVKVFDREGGVVGAFAAPNTSPSSRSPVYLDTDGAGRVYVTDRLQHSIFVFDRDGNYLDTLLDPNDTLREYVASSPCGLAEGTTFSLDPFEGSVRCTPPGGDEQTLPFPDVIEWSPLGVRIDGTGRILVTDVVQDGHRVRLHDTGLPTAAGFDLNLVAFTDGATGQASGEMLFPNVAVADSQGRVYVTDGNNGRISIFGENGAFLGTLGTGSGEGALSLPRGAAIDRRERLHVVDTVGHEVKVYDVSGAEPAFLFRFGQEGIEAGQFSYPSDIALDAVGRLYITDRENGRVQVWSY